MSREPEKTTAVEPEQEIVQTLEDKSEEALVAVPEPKPEELKEEASAEEDSDSTSKSCGSCCETCPNKPQRVLYKEHLVELIGRRISGFGTIPATLFLFVLLVIYSTTTITRFGNVPTARCWQRRFSVPSLFYGYRGYYCQCDSCTFPR